MAERNYGPLLTAEEISELRHPFKVNGWDNVLTPEYRNTICRAQHAKTLRWVAELVLSAGNRASSREKDDQCEPICHSMERMALYNELRALADGRGEGFTK